MAEGGTRAALVTGGARRIGRAIVEALAGEGYAVAIHARSSVAEARRLAATLAAGGARTAVVEGDLGTDADVRRLVPEAAAALGPLTLLVNNASVFEKDELGSLDMAVWRRQFAVNLEAPVMLAEAFAAQAPAGTDASVVNLVDQRVLKLTPQFTSYTLSKAAFHAATRTLAQALAPRGIRVNGIGPGPTAANSRQTDGDFAAQVAALPLRRGPAPRDIAEAVVYLAGAAHVTGLLLTVDGGQHIAWETPDVASIAE